MCQFNLKTVHSTGTEVPRRDFSLGTGWKACSDGGHRAAWGHYRIQQRTNRHGKTRQWISLETMFTTRLRTGDRVDASDPALLG